MYLFLQLILLNQAARVDRAEKENHELKTQLACTGDSLKRLKEDLIRTQSRLDDTQRALEISKQATSSLANEKAALEEKLSQNMSRTQGLSSDFGALQNNLKKLEQQDEEKETALQEANDKIRRLEFAERELNLRLEMQLEHSREMEVRLEQALTRWKQEKTTSQKETDRCSRLRASCSELVEKNQRLQLEMERQSEKLKLYDSLPMPEEIKARMNDLDSDLRHKTAEANDLMTAYENLTSQYNLLLEENQKLGDLLKEKDDALAQAEEEKEHMQSNIDHLHQRTTVMTQSAVLERNNSMTMLEGERKIIADLRRELEDTKESQRQDRVALAHALKAKKKLQMGSSMSRLGSIRSFEDDAKDIIDPFDSPLNSPNGKQSRQYNSLSGISNQLAEGDGEEEGDLFAEQPVDEGKVYTRDPDVRAKAQISIAVEKQDIAGILKLIQTNTKNENFSWRGARALREMLLNNEEKKSECIALNSDEILIASMDLFPDASMVQAQCLRVLGALSFGNDVIRRRMGERGIFKKIVAAIDNHMSEESVLLHALTAITNLTHNSIDNRFR